MSAVWGTAVKGGTLQRRCLAAGGDDGFLRKPAKTRARLGTPTIFPAKACLTTPAAKRKMVGVPNQSINAYAATAA